MTMTAEAVVATSVGVVVMTVDEAKQTISRIKEGLENVRALLLDLYEREGWRALGYESFVTCAEAEFSASKSQAYRLLDAARLDAILSPIGETGLPEAHLRELKTVADEPEVARSIVAKVRALKGEDMTAGDIRAEADEHLARPARAKATRSATVRQSVSSKAEPSDYQDIPDDLILGPTADPDDLGVREDTASSFDDVINNEAPTAGPRERFCNDCGDHYRGAVCPCAATPPPMDGGSGELEGGHAEDDATEAPAGPAAPISQDAVGSEAAAAPGDQAEAGDENDYLNDGTTEPSTDQPGAAEAHGADSAVPATGQGGPTLDPSNPAPSAAHPSRPTTSIGKQTAPAPVRSFTRPLDAGDLTRALFDFPSATVVEAIGEALSSQERGSLAAQLIDALPAAEVARLAHRLNVRARDAEPPDPADGTNLQAALANRSAAEIVDAIAETSTMPRLTELVGLLAERLTRTRLRAAATNGAH